jgi:hypothetical protein
VKLARCWWFTSVIPATQEAEVRRIKIRSQSGEIVLEILSLKNLSQKRADGVTEGAGLEAKPQYHKNKTKQNK